MGAPKKGKEVSEAQREARLKLTAWAKSRRFHKNYIGPDEQGRSTYRAGCGHVVLGPKIPRCWACRQADGPTGTNEFLGRDDKGWSWFRARDCGHVVHGARTKRCRKCWAVKKDREAVRSTLGGYKSVPYARRYEGRQVIFEHREIVERVLGRKLKEGEIVHHLNMDKTDNRNCNLLVCTDDYHRYLHDAMMRAYAKRCSPPKES